MDASSSSSSFGGQRKRKTIPMESLSGSNEVRNIKSKSNLENNVSKDEEKQEISDSSSSLSSASSSSSSSDIQFYRLPSSVAIHHVNSYSQLKKAAKKLFSKDNMPKYLGIDVEWKPCPPMQTPGRICVIQLASEEWSLVIHVVRIEKLPSRIVRALQDENVLKFGVEVADDVSKIEKDFGVKIRSAYDLHDLSTVAGLQFRGLRTLAFHMLPDSPYLDKRKEITCSNWSTESLSEHQIHYAAADAWVSREIGIQLGKKHAPLIQDGSESRMELDKWCLQLKSMKEQGLTARQFALEEIKEKLRAQYAHLLKK